MKTLAAALLLTLAACRKDEMSTYSVAKTPDQPAAAHPAGPHSHDGVPHAAAAAAPQGLPEGHPPIGAAMMPGGTSEFDAMATAAPASLKWKAPAGWAEKPASGMRRATFAVPGGAGPADLSVISLPGDAGGELPNVNRWRAQVGLGAWDAGAFAKAAEKVKSPAADFTVVDLAGPAQRMVVGMAVRNGETWFFKLLGPDATVGAAKPAFKEFLGGVKAAG